MHRVPQPKKHSTNMERPRTVKMMVKVDQMPVKFIISKVLLLTKTSIPFMPICGLKHTENQK